ncbi:hypothetical protein [Bradyrhizobium sp. SZCCHNR2026]|uniref:hypothetical protein n=1 Tax=Bradyrhizobium sp. SZCCHNR2026 TaxID=3057381 RepID=UPI00291692DD|nr:hypothetical protein [Bradyrhizobium sp. SZCCHNR2026]
MSTARRNALQLVHYLRFKVNFNDAASGVAVSKNWLPKGAVILRATATVTSAFNAATTNTLSVGTAGDSTTNIVNAQTVGAVGQFAAAPTGAALGPLTADKQVQVTYTQAGAAATAGAAYVVIEYVPDNDLNIGQ